jgi:hypothetical protein
VLEGAVQLTVAEVSPADAVPIVGAPGAVTTTFKVKLAFTPVTAELALMTMEELFTFTGSNGDVVDPPHVGSNCTEVYVPTGSPHSV